VDPSSECTGNILAFVFPVLPSSVDLIPSPNIILSSKLTSFKASTLLKENDHLHKCVFVVDRKDLDRQTREEFNKFQEKCVEENTHTGALVRRLLSDDYADKVIVTTIQKLGLALDEDSKRNKENKKAGKATYKEQLAPLRDQRLVFIFDECHRSQFGENHQTIKKFFPNSQLFGFTGTPILEQNAAQQQITGDIASLRTTQDLFQQELHAYTITHAIEDRNVLRFHVDYYKPEDENVLRDAPILGKKAVIEAILSKHDAATGGRKFNALLATASTNDAIEYFNLFQAVQAGDLKRARAINDRIYPLAQAFYAAPALDMHNRMKECLVMLGRMERAVVRPPLVRISDAERERLRVALNEAGIGETGALGLAA